MEGKKSTGNTSAGNKTNNKKDKNANRDVINVNENNPDHDVTNSDEVKLNHDVIEDNDYDKPLSERGYILLGLTEAWEWVQITLAVIATPFIIIMLIKIFTGQL